MRRFPLVLALVLAVGLGNALVDCNSSDNGAAPDADVGGDSGTTGADAEANEGGAANDATVDTSNDAGLDDSANDTRSNMGAADVSSSDVQGESLSMADTADTGSGEAADSGMDASDAVSFDAQGDGVSAADAADTGSDGAADAGSDSGSSPTCHSVRLNQATANISAPSTGWGIGTGNWTLEAWVKPHDAFTGGIIVTNNESYLTGEAKVSYDNTTGRVYCGSYSGSCPCGVGTGNPSLASSVGINDGSWHHVACVRNGGNALLFVDGQQVASDVITTSITSTSDIGLGNATGYSYGAAPVFLGPVRFSSAARYAASFTPTANWTVDSSTVTQYLVADAFTGTLIDEAGGDNTSTSASGVTASTDIPPACTGTAGSDL